MRVINVYKRAFIALLLATSSAAQRIIATLAGRDPVFSGAGSQVPTCEMKANIAPSGEKLALLCDPGNVETSRCSPSLNVGSRKLTR